MKASQARARVERQRVTARGERVSPSPTPTAIARLHRTAGNRSMARLLAPTLQRKCARCEEEERVQTKLTVNQVGDEYEREADRVADEVMRMPAPVPAIQRKLSILHRNCTACGGHENAKEKKPPLKAEHDGSVKADAVDGIGPYVTPTSPAIQRACAECEEESEPIQAKRAADGVSDEVMRMPASGPAIQRTVMTVQCKCASCEAAEIEAGASALVSRKCEACARDEDEEADGRIQAKQEAGVRTGAVDGVATCLRGISGQGRPLDPATQRDLEMRFGHDFQHVRVHDDAAAAESARSIHARAYTFGHRMVFEGGEFATGTPVGRRLLAHELTHVIQQGHASDKLQRQADDCPSGRHLQVEHAQGCLDISRERGERRRFEVVGPRLRTVRVFECYAIENFSIGSADFGVLRGLDEIADFLLLNPEVTMHVTGFTDCLGDELANANLRTNRASAVEDYFVDTLNITRDRIFIDFADDGEYLSTNDTADGRATNRAVAIRLDRGTAPERREPTEPAPSSICGPDVTEEIARAMAAAGRAFSALSMDDKIDCCFALVFTLHGALWSWDIVELHNRGWIPALYQPPCATANVRPACEHSVQVGDECYFGGSPNYVLYGYYMRRCYEDYGGAYPAVRSTFTKSSMLAHIDAYKGEESILGEGGNWRVSRQWAEAGYDGWPNGGTLPPGDRHTCAPQCTTTFIGPDFMARWCPHIDPGNQCIPAGRAL